MNRESSTLRWCDYYEKESDMNMVSKASQYFGTKEFLDAANKHVRAAIEEAKAAGLTPACDPASVDAPKSDPIFIPRVPSKRP